MSLQKFKRFHVIVYIGMYNKIIHCLLQLSLIFHFNAFICLYSLVILAQYIKKFNHKFACKNESIGSRK